MTRSPIAARKDDRSGDVVATANPRHIPQTRLLDVEGVRRRDEVALVLNHGDVADILRRPWRDDGRRRKTPLCGAMSPEDVGQGATWVGISNAAARFHAPRQI